MKIKKTWPIKLILMLTLAFLPWRRLSVAVAPSLIGINDCYWMKTVCGAHMSPSGHEKWQNTAVESENTLTHGHRPYTVMSGYNLQVVIPQSHSWAIVGVIQSDLNRKKKEGLWPMTVSNISFQNSSSWKRKIQHQTANIACFCSASSVVGRAEEVAVLRGLTPPQLFYSPHLESRRMRCHHPEQRGPRRAARSREARQSHHLTCSECRGS